ncbi:MAG TPA: DUF167 domain-containing protein [Coriobacteriia bacterium]
MSARITVRATPRSGRDSIEAGTGGVFLVRVTAPPDEGRANAAVCKVFAEALGVPKSAVTVVRGHSARVKTLEIAGMTDDEAAQRLPR